MSNPFRYFNSSPEVIRLVVMMYVRYPLSLRNVEDLLAERGAEISHEARPVLVARCSRPRSAGDGSRRCAAILWSWHLDEIWCEIGTMEQPGRKVRFLTLRRHS